MLRGVECNSDNMKISGISEAPDATITIMRLPIQNLVCDKCEPKMVELVELSSKSAS